MTRRGWFWNPYLYAFAEGMAWPAEWLAWLFCWLRNHMNACRWESLFSNPDEASHLRAMQMLQRPAPWDDSNNDDDIS